MKFLTDQQLLSKLNLSFSYSPYGHRIPLRHLQSIVLALLKGMAFHQRMAIKAEEETICGN